MRLSLFLTLLSSSFVVAVAAASTVRRRPRRGLKTGGGYQRCLSGADLLIIGGKVVTMNKEKEIIGNGGIAVVDSKIDYVGDADTLLSMYCKDGSKKTIQVGENDIVMPGLVNGHSHNPMTLLRSIAGDDLSLQDWLNQFIFPAESKTVNPAFVRVGAALGAMEMISTGTTTYTDMYYFADEQAHVIDRIGLRTVLGQAVIGFPVADARTPADALNLTRTFLANWKGHPRITPAVAPHSPYTLNQEYLDASAKLAREFGAPIHIHVSETETEVNTIKEQSGGLTPFEYLNSFGLLGPDVIAAHSVVLTRNDIDIILETETGLVHNPESNMKLASGVMPVPDLKEKGVKLGLGTDGPASNDNLDMMEAILITPLLQKVNNMETTVISAYPVLEMATIEGARALGMEETIGSLEPGKQADIIILDGTNPPHMVPAYDLISLIVYSAKGCDVLSTIVAGQVLYEDRKFLTLDPVATFAAARRQAGIVREAVGIF